MSNQLEKTLSQIVLDDHRAAAIFENHNMDYCCKGKRTLAEVCEEKQINPGKIVSELNELTSSNSAVNFPYDKLPLGGLAEHIERKHHDYTRRVMPLILQYLQKIVSKHGERYPYMSKVFETFVSLKEEMDLHMEKEEKVLFPRIRQVEEMDRAGQESKLNATYLLAPINMMEQEHDHAGSALEAIRALCNNYVHPETACTTHRVCLDSLRAFEADLHQHVHLENNVLFPRAIEMFRKNKPSLS